MRIDEHRITAKKEKYRKISQKIRKILLCLSEPAKTLANVLSRGAKRSINERKER